MAELDKRDKYGHPMPEVTTSSSLGAGAQKLEANNNSGFMSIRLSDDAKRWFMAVAFVGSVMINIAMGVLLYNEIHAKTVAKDLADYNLTFFINHDFADLKADVKVRNALLESKCK